MIWVHRLYSKGKIGGAIHESGVWKILLSTNKPEYCCIKKVENILEIIDRKKKELASRPLTNVR